MDKRLLVLLITMILLTGCVKTATLSAEKNQTGDKQSKTTKNDVQTNNTSNETVSEIKDKQIDLTNLTDVEVTSANITLESNETENQAPAEPAKPKNRIDAKTGTSSSEVTSQWDGKTETYTVPDIDLDAIAFDIAQHMSKGIREVRPFIYINGNPYLKPAELKKELDKYAQKEIVTFNASTIPIIVTKEDGFIRGVGCDLEGGYIRIDLTNPSENPIKIFQNNNIYPKVKEAFVLSLNRRTLEDMDCGGSLIIAPGKNVTCVRASAVFIAAGSRNQASTDASYDTSQPDMVAGSKPGHQEQIKFYCSAKNVTSSE